MSNFYYFLIILLFISNLIFGQTNYEPVSNKDVYSFLDEMSIKNLIDYKNVIKPVKRIDIARYLFILKNDKKNLTGNEKEILNIFISEYYYDILKIQNDTSTTNEFVKVGVSDRLQLYKYYDKNFSFFVDPIFGVEYEINSKSYHQYTGIGFRGNINNWGFYMNYRDNYEKGNSLDRSKEFSPMTGVIESKGTAKSFEYSEARAGITYNWSLGDITLAKDFLNIGSSPDYQIILSSKAPSFPYIKLDLKPLPWLQFVYIHAWLNSDLIDSSTIRYTNSKAIEYQKNYDSRTKYYVSHLLSFNLINNLNFTLGESIIYSDRLEPIYFIPIMFFRLADHYLSKHGGTSGDNAQIFFDISYNVPSIKSKLYSSVYIDELSLENFFNNKAAEIIGVQLGSYISNPLWKNSYINVEYTGIYPYTYMNANPAENYASSNYTMGHWIGSSSEQFLFGFKQYITPRLKFESNYRYIVKGQKEDINNYYIGSPAYSFLYGPHSFYNAFNLKLQYLLISNLYLNMEYQNIISLNGRFINEFNKKAGPQIQFSINYGY